MREMRQCSARDRIRSSTSCKLSSVPSASRVAKSCAPGSNSPSANSDQKVRARSSPRVPATSAAKSICKAHSRALRREPIKVGAPTSGRRFAGTLPRTLPARYRPRFRAKNFLIKISQLNRRPGRFVAFIVQLLSGAIDCLIDIVCRNDAKQQRYAGLQACLADPARGLGGDVIEVWRLSSDDHSETNYGVEFSGLRRLQSTE